MKYIVIDGNGNDITSTVKVIAETTESYQYCRKKADDMFSNADTF